tara:strand:- start:356 stop:2263 length:1908 start_codon:yes stop_codon:yes gene_type:complete
VAHKAYICFFYGALLASPVAALGDSELEDLMALDLEELSVSVASKREENLRNAPGVISIISADEIRRYGGQSLIDVLNRLPGFQFTNGLNFQYNTFASRGQTVQHYSNRTLFLINGRPFRDSLTGGVNAALFTKFPLDAIQRLEVIRGPGSVLYGSNAFSSVVNIITRNDADETGNASIAATIGTHDESRGEVYAAQKGEDYSVTTAWTSTTKSDESFSLRDESGTPGSYTKRLDGFGFLGAADYKNLSLNVFRAEVDTSALNGNFPSEVYDQERTFVDIGYDVALNDTWRMQNNVTHNRLYLFTQRSEDVLLETSFNGHVSKDIQLLIGGSFEDQEGTLPSEQTYKRQFLRGYSQLDWQTLSWLKLFGGLQLNKPEQLDTDVSPRFGAIAQFDEMHGLKLLYAEAYRTGYAFETDVTFPGIITGNPQLEPEKIATWEAQLFYYGKQEEATLTAYHSDTSDIIQRVGAPGGGVTFVNGGEADYRGLEFEGKTHLNDEWSALGSVTYQENERKGDGRDASFSPHWTFKVGLSYETDDYQLGLFDSYFSKPTNLRSINPAVLEVNPQPDAYHQVTLNATFDLNHLWLGDNAPQTELNFYADNLLDEEVYYPEYNRQQINSFPLQNGRNLYARLKMYF